jgi:hypothetical protein
VGQSDQFCLAQRYIHYLFIWIHVESPLIKIHFLAGPPLCFEDTPSSNWRVKMLCYEGSFKIQSSEKEKLMTTLGKLKKMSDVQIQNWLQKVGYEHVDELVMALMGADDVVRQCVFRNMSGPAVAALKHDLEQQKNTNIDSGLISSSASRLEKMM